MLAPVGRPNLRKLTPKLISARRTSRAVIALVAFVTVTGSAATASPALADVMQKPFSLNAGQELTAGQAIYSPFNQFDLTMQSDGNVVEYGNGHALWTTHTSGTGNRLLLQADGNLVVYSAKGKALWQSGSRGTAAELEIGLFADVDLDAQTGEIWSEHPSNYYTATSGDVMTADQALRHEGGLLTLQADGNLVDERDSKILWSSKTSGARGDSLHVQKDGNVVLTSAKGKALWSTETAGAGPTVQLTETAKGVVEVVKGSRVLWHAG